MDSVRVEVPEVKKIIWATVADTTVGGVPNSRSKGALIVPPLDPSMPLITPAAEQINGQRMLFLRSQRTSPGAGGYPIRRFRRNWRRT